MASQRRNPLSGEWITVSPGRLNRPWDGERASADDQGFSKVRTYLSPGATRSNGVVNPDYTSTFTFPNDFPSFKPSSSPVNTSPGFTCQGSVARETGTRSVAREMKETVPSSLGTSSPDTLSAEDDELFTSGPVSGECRVMCFSPHSDMSLPLMGVEEIRGVVEEWRRISRELSHYRCVQIFENKGAMVGCSNQHPHCQIWACEFLPYKVGLQDTNQREYFRRTGKVMLHEYLSRELASKTRIVEETAHWVALVPYWAYWPFELLVLPKRHVGRLRELTEAEVTDLAVAMNRYLTRYDNLFSCSFPYSMGWMEAPNSAPSATLATNSANPTQGPDRESQDHWQLHAHYFPPLLRSHSVKKHYTGFEMFAQAQRDLTPEEAAQRLRDCDPDTHFRNKM